jgi:hypothetical protein
MPLRVLRNPRCANLCRAVGFDLGTCTMYRMRVEERWEFRN